MDRFRYLRDPAFVFCCLSYASNRWLIKPHVHNAFIHGYFNDVLLIPCALPPLLLTQRWLGLRRNDLPPLAGEILFHLVIWSMLFEWIGPKFMPHTTGDPWDVVAYFVGGALAWLWWHRATFLRQPSTAP